MNHSGQLNPIKNYSPLEVPNLSSWIVSRPRDNNEIFQVLVVRNGMTTCSVLGRAVRHEALLVTFAKCAAKKTLQKVSDNQ